MPSRLDIREQSRLLVKRLANSDLATQLPPRLRTALATLACAASVDNETGETDQRTAATTVSGRAAAQALRAFEGVVARAANVVFATTNSSELERLIDERGQFDWAIVEEAGKATGSELVSPLLLSHRRLMIGDHKQLPPFASDQLIALLEAPEKVMETLKIGEEFIGRSLRDATTEEILDEIEEDENELPALCSEALRVLTFFENAIEAEFRRQARNRGGRPIAKKLTTQHRMHPDIASLVSRCFYEGELKSHPDCILRYQTEQRPFTSADLSRLPLTPIVVIDMPYVQSTVGQQKGDQYPRWHNPMEVEAVLDAVSLLRPNLTGIKAPTLAILSPYTQQVRRLDATICDVRATKLPDLSGFAPPSHTGMLCHTVDSFQGSEADVVIVSLVRNNEHSNVQNALGFLSDVRRMNVLLSRARWQLVLIASLDFLSEVVSAVKGGEDEKKIHFIAEMLKELGEGQQRGAVSRVPLKQLDKGSG